MSDGEVATQGPAHLDLTNGVAHKTHRCPIFVVHAVSSSVATEGDMTGFVWCGVCGHQEFEPEDTRS